MTKIKAVPKDSEAQLVGGSEERTYAQPLASCRLTRKLYKCIKKAVKQKQIRRSEGVMCEDQNLPYVNIPSKTDLEATTGSKRPTCVIMVKPHEDYQEIYDKCLEEVQALPAPLRRAAARSAGNKELLVNLNPITQPLASCRLTHKLYKRIKKAVKQKQIRRGVKEVQKFVNKGEKGIMVLAGDTLPIEVYCHLPVMCEDQNLPYVNIPSKTDLEATTGSKRPTCVIMVKPHEDYQEIYDKCLEEVQALPAPL
ncbi:H/ACA ribonucleoprotein complex subunit 2 [Microtus ochrogaster]|uniref:H/ACA ribonucleoprotein complex subunit 2 n=1 Tax=Microtus ochrogaster TaxID=79684 RepID=A0A8J6G051_MICOH|nr:H/ACA ribonucleoprotein complex subunit 2 [Microtus ochrogaster]